MIYPLAGLLFGALFGALRAKRRGGAIFDLLQWGAVFAMLFGLIGLFIGTGILWICATLFDWPFALPIGAMIGSITFSAMVGLFFGIWPAKKAAKLDPATSLRYE